MAFHRANHCPCSSRDTPTRVQVTTLLTLQVMPEEAAGFTWKEMMLSVMLPLSMEVWTVDSMLSVVGAEEELKPRVVSATTEPELKLVTVKLMKEE